MESFPGCLSHKIVGDGAARREVGRSIVGSDAAFVIAKDHVHDARGSWGPSAFASNTSEVL
jgi:hypothetical protein